jgi:hypothetical protein
MTCTQEVARLNNLALAGISSERQAARFFQRLEELETWERPEDGMCYVCSAMLRTMAGKRYWQKLDLEYKAEVSKLKKLKEEL